MGKGSSVIVSRGIELGDVEIAAVVSRLLDEGVTIKDAAEMIGVSRPTIYNRYKKVADERKAEIASVLASSDFETIREAVLDIPKVKARAKEQQEADHREMLRLAKDGMPRAAIAAKYGITKTRLLQIFNEMGYHGRITGISREGAVEEALALNAKGMTPAGIAVKFGIRLDRLFDVMDEKGQRFPLPDHAVAMADAGFSPKEIARAVGWEERRLKKALDDEAGIHLTSYEGHPHEIEMLTMILQGVPKQQILDRLGVGFRALNAAEQRAGFPPLEEHVHAIRKGVAEGRGIDEMALALGVHRNQVATVMGCISNMEEGDELAPRGMA
ncbi:MAG: hypothetical protein VR70_10900 [Rhodospirillaceae bacterium BRH_c57]|nr:MAG: hypothetical protein VR70_10900 [Rhodospirillaceae bacterium BRH_c57]